MFQIIKYIKVLLKFKDVRKIYKEENGTDKPGWASRRFIGAAILFIGILLQTFFGIELDNKTLTSLSDNFGTLTGAARVVIPVGVQLYGLILAIVGAVKKSQVTG
jgi:hypothetical protein